MSSATKLYLIKNTCLITNIRQVFRHFSQFLSLCSLGHQTGYSFTKKCDSVQTLASLSFQFSTPSFVMRMQFGVSTLIGLPF